MRIAIISTQNNGKTTLINAFKQIWPNYISPKNTYRDLIKEKGLSINEQGTEESQRIIRDSLIDNAIDYAQKKYTISDRNIIDNLVYTLWLSERGRIKDTDFTSDSILIARETCKFYDIIFWLPLNHNIVMDEQEHRSNDPIFRAQIDEIYLQLYESFKCSENILFDINNSPPIIPLTGNLNEKISQIKNYINDEGDLLETKTSLMDELDSFGSSFETQNFIDQVRKGR